MEQIIILWVIFGIIFFLLSIFHFCRSTKRIEKFQIHKRPVAECGQSKVLGSDIDQPIKDFVEDFNQYIEKTNNSSKWMNIVAGIGYVLASLTAFFSLYLSIVGK